MNLQLLEAVGDVSLTIRAPAEVERRDADGVTSSDEGVVTVVNQHEREHAVQHTHNFLTDILILPKKKQQYTINTHPSITVADIEEKIDCNGELTRCAMTSQSEWVWYSLFFIDFFNSSWL